MKRVLAVLALLLIPAALHAFDAKKRSARRIGVLRPSDYRYADERIVAGLIAKYLREDLRNRGFDAYDTGLTFDEVAKGEGEDADYYIELRGTGAQTGSYGAVGIGSDEGGVSFEVLAARVATEVRVYDGPTGDLLHTETLKKKTTSVMPTSIGISGSHVFAVIAMPFVQQAQYRSAARATARSAANVLAEHFREQ